MVRTFSLLFILFFSSATQSLAANISTYVDRQSIIVNESFNLIFEADSSVDEDPDFSPLTVYFDILNRSQSSNMTLINGDFSRKTVWTLSLLAKQAGSYAIPAIGFGKDQSRPLTIKVESSNSQTSSVPKDKSIFLEASLDHDNAYVQAQLIYTVKLYRSVEMQNASLTEPKLSDADAIVEKMGDDKRYQATKNGLRYQVIERRYAIFPQQSGQLSILPVEFNGEIITQRRSFFDVTPFSNTTKRALSKQIDIVVKPIPPSFTNKHWLPAAEVQLVDEWPDNAQFKVGEPVTRTLSLLAKGLTASQLPPIAPQQLDDFKLYPDQPKLNNQVQNEGMIGIRQEKIAYIPTKAGKLTLPEINIAWWNTQTNQLEYARVASKTINVNASKVNNPQNPALDTVQSQAVPSELGSTAATQAQTNNASKIWIYSSIFFALAWLLTLYYFLIHKPTQPLVADDDLKTKTKPVKRKNLRKKIISACHQNNAALCKSLLIEWGQAHWPEQTIQSLGQLSHFVGEDLATEIERLNQLCYSRDEQNWSADALSRQFEKYTGKPDDQQARSSKSLININKLQ